MDNFSFGGVRKSSRKSQVMDLHTYASPLLVDKSDAEAIYENPIVILVEDQYDETAIKGVDKFLKLLGCTKYIMLNVLNCEAKFKDGEMIKFYKANISKFNDFIPKGSPIITSGSAIYSYLQEDDIYPNHVEQCIFGVTNFWFSPTLESHNCHRVYPIESFKDDLFLYGWDKNPQDSYKTKLAQVQIKKAIKNNAMRPPRYPKLNKVFIESREDFLEKFYEPNKHRKGEVLSWDTETSGLNFYTDRIGCITLSFDGITGYYIPWHIVEDGKGRGDSEIKQKLGEILKNNLSAGANLKFDTKFIRRNGIEGVTISEDIIQMGHTLDENRKNSLKSLAFYYTPFGGYERKLDEYVEKKKGNKEQVNYLDIPEEILRDYAVMDAIVTKRVYDAMLAHMRALDKKFPNACNGNHGLEYYYRTYRIPACNTYALMEYHGVPVDKERLDNLRIEMSNTINGIKRELSEKMGVSDLFDWTSSQKLGRLLEKKGWEDYGRTEGGDYATGDFQMVRWKKTHTEAVLLEKMKSYNTLLNTFVGDAEGTKGWTQYLVQHDDGSWYMHPNFMCMLADSGRSRCNSPNMQQVPSHGTYSKEIKSCIRTPNDEDYYLVTVDYSSLQMRLAALSYKKWDSLKDIFYQEGADVHSMTGFLTYVKGNELDIEIIEVEQDGKEYKFLGGQQILVKHEGDEVPHEIFARNLVETDTLIV